MTEIENGDERIRTAGLPSLLAVLDEIRDLKLDLNRSNGTILVPIATLAPEPYQLL